MLTQRPPSNVCHLFFEQQELPDAERCANLINLAPDLFNAPDLFPDARDTLRYFPTPDLTGILLRTVKSENTILMRLYASYDDCAVDIVKQDGVILPPKLHPLPKDDKFKIACLRYRDNQDALKSDNIMEMPIPASVSSTFILQ
jgi:hypothetical protein